MVSTHTDCSMARRGSLVFWAPRAPRYHSGRHTKGENLAQSPLPTATQRALQDRKPPHSPVLRSPWLRAHVAQDRDEGTTALPPHPYPCRGTQMEHQAKSGCQAHRGSGAGRASRSPSETTSAHGGPCEPPGTVPQDDTCGLRPTIQGAGRPQERTAKQQSEDRDGWEPGPSNQKGGDISGGGRGRGRTKESRRGGGGRGRCAQRRSAGRPLRRQRLAARVPSLPRPGPYLTLVRPLRSVHLLDMSVQVVRPGKERPRETLEQDLQRAGAASLARPPPYPCTTKESQLAALAPEAQASVARFSLEGEGNELSVCL